MSVVLIYGKSGSGKSRSMKNLDRENTLLVNVQNKLVPFRGGFPKTFVPTGISKDGKEVGYVEQIVTTIKKTLDKYPNVNVVVIDDAGYLMTKVFMAKHKQKSGAASFELYNEIGDDFWTLFNECSLLSDPAGNLRNDVNVYIMMHEEVSDYGDVKLKTIGKLLDQKVVLEGMTTVCLRCMTDGKEHWFQTQSTGADISKSPEEMFPQMKIDNDLAKVDQLIREYYKAS